MRNVVDFIAIRNQKIEEGLFQDEWVDAPSPTVLYVFRFSSNARTYYYMHSSLAAINTTHAFLKSGRIDNVTDVSVIKSSKELIMLIPNGTQFPVVYEAHKRCLSPVGKS